MTIRFAPAGHRGLGSAPARGWRRLGIAAGLLSLLAGLGAVAATPAGATPTPAFSDGSFETPVVAPGTFQRIYAGQPLGPWTVTSGSVDLSGAGFWQTADGVQSLDLDGADLGSIAQTFSTHPFTAYEVSFALAGNPVSGPTVKTGELLANGRDILNYSFNITGKTETNMGYVPQEATFLSTGTSSTLEFVSTTPGGYGPVLDNVTVQSCLLIICLN